MIEQHQHNHWANVLRAEDAGEDLQQDEQDNIVVCMLGKAGDLYELGIVSQALVYQNPEAARAAISKIKLAYCGRRKQESTDGKVPADHD